MSYKDRRRKGSWRGVPFFTKGSELEGGRRGTTHEFPLQKLPRQQDLGLAAKTFVIECFVIGADYDVARDNLIKALDKGGPGKLVHRTFGEMQAELQVGQRYRCVEELENEQRIARFTIPFIRVDEARDKIVKIDTAVRLKSAANLAKVASIASAARKFNFSGPEFLRREILGAITRAISAVQSINDQVTGALAGINQINQAIKHFGSVVGTLVATPGKLWDLAQGGFGLHDAIFSAIGSIAYGFKRTIDSFAKTGKTKAREEARAVLSAATLALKQGMKVGDDEPEITGTAARAQQRRQNQQAFVQLMQQSAVISCAAATSDMSFESNAEAIAMRDLVVANLVEQAQATDDAEVFAALQDLRVEADRHLTAVAGEAPQQRDFYLHTSIPALLVAHLAHADATRAEEIISRNGMRHPGFCAGGYPVKIVVDA